MEKFNFSEHIDVQRLARFDGDILRSILEALSGQESIQRIHDLMLDYTAYEVAMYISVLVKSSLNGQGLDYIRYLRSVGWVARSQEGDSE